jgi:aryl-alcohol dehydrogenase-like predicted oxidoreductase
MQMTKLGHTGIDVSAYCLGTMTWGRQTDEPGAHEQLELALDHGINFLDTAEMYPVNPVLAESVGDTETIIGNWIARTGRRDDWVIATKVTGENGRFVRQGQLVTPATLREALEGSLRRLQTDVIDLYQLHWPNRGSFHFRQMWRFDPSKQDGQAEIDNIHALAETLKDCVAEGKIRAWGLSNDSVWGTMQWLKAAEATGGPRVASIQNEYSLLCRQYDTDLGEMGFHEDVTLLAFSPLACGLLTGKYRGGAQPEGSRLVVGTGDLGGRTSERSVAITDRYLDLADEHGRDPVHMALEWCVSRPFPVIPIFGATTTPQLRQILDGAGTGVSDDLKDAIDTLHRSHPYPY